MVQGNLARDAPGKVRLEGTDIGVVSVRAGTGQVNVITIDPVTWRTTTDTRLFKRVVTNGGNVSSNGVVR